MIEAALLYGMNSNTSTAELKDKIMLSSDRLSSLTGKVGMSAKINYKNAVYNSVYGEIIDVPDTDMVYSGIPEIGGVNEFNLLSEPAVEGQFITIAGGSYHCLALREDGTVWAWGDNEYGQLGDGTTTQSSTPVQVSGLSEIIAVSCGAHHSLALKSDGTVWAWGCNSYGQLGDGTTIHRTTPVQVSGLNGIITVA